MKIMWTSILITSLIEIGLLFIFTSLFLFIFARPIIKWMVGQTLKRFMEDKYNANVWELVTAMTRVSPIAIMENSMRATSGQIISRPFGSPRKFMNFDGLIFSPAQLFKLPAFANAPVDMKTTIGPHAKQPLIIDIPIMAAAMGYAVAVSSKVKRAIARATASIGTATNSGHGAFLPEERKLAKYFILQYSAVRWSKSPEILQQAHAIEIHLGQGASVTSNYKIPPEELTGEIRETFHLVSGETLVIPSRFDEISRS